jgi:CHAD domain-containing protein
VPPDYQVPDLKRLTGKGGAVAVDTVAIESTYHDTETMDLLRYRLTLRRREGQADTGWQLKIPGSDFRTELHWPVAGETLPDDARSLLRPFLGVKLPIPAVRLEVARTRHRLSNSDGELLAEIAHDDVRAFGLGVAVRAPRWQEVEAELGPAEDLTLLARIDAALTRAGALPSTSRSKLARAVLGIGNESVGSPRASAGAVLLDYISVQVDALVAGHFAIHEGAEDAVHQTRVACRRLRSTLSTFEYCFDADAAEALRTELAWYAGVLGEVRDREVLRTRLDKAIAELAPELVVGPVAERIDSHLDEELIVKRAELLACQDSERYAQLLSSAVSWRDDPPFTAAAGRPARILRESIQRMEKKLLKRLTSATSKLGSDTDMHDARKAGKRARYAAEAVESQGSPLVEQTKAVQDLLGEFQDSVVAAEFIRRLAAAAASRGEDGFTYGVLLADERTRARQAKSRARRL